MLAYTRVMTVELAYGWVNSSNGRLQTPCPIGMIAVQKMAADGSLEDIDLNNAAAAMPTTKLCMLKVSSSKHVSNAKPVCQLTVLGTEHKDGSFAGAPTLRECP